MHNTTPVPKNYCAKITDFNNLSIKEGVMKRVKHFENKKLGITLEGKCM